MIETPHLPRQNQLSQLGDQILQPGCSIRKSNPEDDASKCPLCARCRSCTDLGRSLGRASNRVRMLVPDSIGELLDRVPANWLEHWPEHIYVGLRIGDQPQAERDLPLLLDVPAPVRFILLDALSGPVDLAKACCERSTALSDIDQLGAEIDQVIISRASMAAASMHPEWIALIQRQCAAAEIPVLTAL